MKGHLSQSGRSNTIVDGPDESKDKSGRSFAVTKILNSESGRSGSTKVDGL